MSDQTDPKSRILDLLKTRGDHGLRRSEMRRALSMNNKADAKAFKAAFRELLNDGMLMRKRGGRYVLSESRELVPGVFQATTQAFGFVTPERGGEDIFIPPKGVRGAIAGDKVLVSITESGDERGPVGEVHRITDRDHRELVGAIVILPSGIAIKPLRRELPDVVNLARRGHQVPPDDLEPGQWVEVRLNPQESPREPLNAVVLRRIEGPNPISTDLDAICAEFDLPEPYSESDQAAAAARQPLELPREDATDLRTITIDPVDAKDFDDALSLSSGTAEGVVRVGIHIADVASYVTPGSRLDEGARHRGFTAYLPGRTLPMLPKPLASDLCSLIEGERRAAHSVFLDIDEKRGEVVGYRRVRTWLEVDARLSFEQVEEVLSGDDSGQDGMAPAIRELVERLNRLARRMRSRRAEEEAFLALSLPEVRILASEDPPKIHGLQRVIQSEAHQLVEEYMLAANTGVGKELQERDVPGLFRNHGEPRSADLRDFADWVGQTLGRRPAKLEDRRKMNSFLESVNASPLRDAVLAQFLRALPRAGYGASCDGHYGLGKDIYAHFTSPIRRYPDLLVHQQLQAADGYGTARTPDECKELGDSCTGLEEQVDTAYFAAVDRLKLRYMHERELENPGESYEGVVMRCVRDGLLVYLGNVGLMGFLPLSRLGGGRFHLDRRTGKLTDSRGGKTYKTGDVIYVQVRRADTVRGELHLDPIRPRV